MESGRCRTVPQTAIQHSNFNEAAVPRSRSSAVVNHRLRHTETVPQINEKKTAVVAQFKNPTVKNDLFSNIGGCQLTARMCSLITFHALKITHSGEFVQHRIFFSGARAPAARTGLSAAIRGLPRFPPGKAAALPYALFPSAAHLRFNPSRLMRLPQSCISFANRLSKTKR